MPITPSDIAARRKTHIGYLLCTNEEIAQELEREAKGDGVPPSPPPNPDTDPKTDDITGYLKRWQTFYKEVFERDVDIDNIWFQGIHDGFNWLIIMLEGLTNEGIYNVLKSRMKAWKYSDNLDTITSDRTTTQTYAIWVRDCKEADEKWKNTSANTLKQKKINCITLPERLILELFFHYENPRKHLDKQNVTLCAGSRNPDGNVPCVFWDDELLQVSWCNPSDANDGIRAREAVS